MFFARSNNNQQLLALEEKLTATANENTRLAQENQFLQQRIRELEQAGQASANFEQKMCGAWIRGGALIHKTRESLAGNATALLKEREALAESRSIFEESRAAVGLILERVQHIRDSSNQGSRRLSELVELTAKIEKFVSVIADISDQTNLLALNAAIEAARAGESGRGFAVVADEVRNLARKASDASGEIANLVTRITHSTGGASEDIDAVKFSSDEVVASAEQIRSGVAQVVDLSDHMHRVICSSAADAFFETVKLDHVAWKNSIYDSIISGRLDSAQAVADHTSCRLGQWYYAGEGAKAYSSLHSFSRLEQPHEQVHRSGLAALHAARDKQFDQVIRHLAHMEEASLKVGELIGEMAREAARGAS